MRVAIVHYHLQTGGVTRIIQHARAALAAREYETLILTGEPPARQMNRLGPAVVVPGLGYEGRRPSQSPSELAKELDRAARQHFGESPDIWHVHNHSLGKNLTLPGALRRLAEQGQRMLLQIHDFAEDGRPGNYNLLLRQCGEGDPARLSEILYPAADQVHYAVLNSRDLAFMSKTGLPGSRLHLLPNPVEIIARSESERPRAENGRLWLYATRAIKRKNLGEFLLWAALAGMNDRFAVTQAPQNPAERPLYDHWVDLSNQLNLPLEFEVGTRPGIDFFDLLGTAHALVTTSVAEGFGMTFLEPWLVGRPVTGRNLPEITHEMEETGVALGHMYDRLDVPLDWVNAETLRRKAAHALESMLQAYGRRVGQNDLERVLDAWIRKDRVDFGRLDPELQETVIRRIANQASLRNQMLPQALDLPDSVEQRIGTNQAAIAEHFGIGQYGTRLINIYDRLLTSRVDRPGSLDGEQLLDAFLAPERLSLLRSG